MGKETLLIMIFLLPLQFKRMLNKELSHFSESKSGNQISEYICSTFLGKEYRIQLFLIVVERYRRSMFY